MLEYNVIEDFYQVVVVEMEFLSAKETAEKWNITRRRVQILCEEGRIGGAFKLSSVWVIPKDAEKPADRRKIKKNPPKMG